MPIKDILKTHRTWEDGADLMLGIAIGLSPWFYDEPTVPAVVLKSGLTGLAVLALAQLELVHLRRWEEIAQKRLLCNVAAAPHFLADAPITTASTTNRERTLALIQYLQVAKRPTDNSLLPPPLA